MKSLSFATSSFGALTSLFLALLNMTTLSSHSGSVQGAVLPRDGPGLLPPSNIPLDLVPKYFDLMDRCNAGGPDANIGVLYEGGAEVVYKSGQCGQRKLNGKHNAQLVVVCKTIMCNFYSMADCTRGPLLPAPVLFAPGEQVPYPFNLTQILLGAAGKCQVV